MGGNEHVVDLKRPRKGVLDLINDPTAERRSEPEVAPSIDEFSLLPGRDEEYRAYSRPSNKPVPTLVFILADTSILGFPYALLDSVQMIAGEKPADGPVIVLRFAGLEAVEVRISGRRIDSLLNYVCFHRVSWVKERPPTRDFEPDQSTVVTRITIIKNADTD